MRKAKDYDFKDKRVYLSGPMTGCPDWNRPTFAKYATHLRDLGTAFVFDPAFWLIEGAEDHTHAWWMRRSLNELTAPGDGGACFYDCIALIPGWRSSKGAMDEYHVARACGIEAVAL